MFFKRLKCLNIFLSALILSSQALAGELSGDYAYLSKINSIPSTVVYNSSNQKNNLPPIKLYPRNSPVVKELDRLEAIQEALNHSGKILKSSPAVLNKDFVNKEEVLLVKNSLTEKSKKEWIGSSQEMKTILIEDILSSSPTRPGIRLAYNTSIIIQVKNIQKFLAMDEGFIKVEKFDRDHIRVDALKYGGTFLNIWDDKERRTIYVGVIFPETQKSEQEINLNQAEQHEAPFRFLYSNDWNTYYFGAKGDDFKRQSYSFSQNFGLQGQTPYGFFDTSMSTNEFKGISEISSYTVGLSQIPIEGIHNFNIRAFDANRNLSPLTLSNTYLRGVFTDAELLDDLIGVSYSYGEKRPFFAFISQNNSNALDSYISAFKLTLLPTDRYNQISFNVAESLGSQREENLAKKVYSIEARKKILNTYLNGEYAQGEGQHASLAGLRWKEEGFSSAINLRQVNKNFTTISGTPSNQGEIGAIWSTSLDGSRITAETSLDMYRQYLYFNPNNPDAINFDFYGRLRVPLISEFWSETTLNYLHTPGEISPRRNVGLGERISKSINLLGFKNTNIYTGANLQKVRYEFSSASAYNRYSFLSGIQIPITKRLSIYANYEYSWVNEIFTENDFNPNVFNTGFYYNRQLTDKLSGRFDMSYHKEGGVKGASSYLAGEDSAGISLGFSYNPTNDVDFFIDGRTRKVWPQVEGNVSYNDLDVRLGLRMSFDVLKRGWDPYGTVGGHVYKDKNGDGKYDKGDQGVKGVKVKVGYLQAVTDDQGYYSLPMNAKKVLVAPETETIPSGVVFSTPTAQMAKVKQWGVSKVDFGLNSQTGVYGLIFVDKNNNTAPDVADQFLKGIKIVLDKKYTSLTDAQGAFYFRNIADGEHTVVIDLNSLPINMIPQVKLENQIRVVEGTTYIFHVPLKVKDSQPD